MKKFLIILTILILGSFLAVGSAGAQLIPYWTLTHFETDPVDGTAFVQLTIDDFVDNNVGFGFYNLADPTTVDQYAEIFGPSDDAVTPKHAKFTQQADDTWDLEIISGSVVENTYEDFGVTFGFYFYRDWNGGGISLIHSDSQFDQNVQEGYMEMTYFELADNVYVDLLWGEDGLGAEVYVDDVQPSPVPEPATMLLLGSGLIGLAGIGRKKFSKKA